jgi:DNA-binding NarL/FixJ family response regulator
LRIVIGDQSQDFRSRVRELLQTRTQFEICGEATDGEELVQLARRLLPDLIVSEYMLPIVDGVEAAELIRRFHPRVLILLVSFHQDEDLISRARSAGVNGYIPKLDTAESLLPAVDAILGGGSFFPTKG